MASEKSSEGWHLLEDIYKKCNPHVPLYQVTVSSNSAPTLSSVHGQPLMHQAFAGMETMSQRYLSAAIKLNRPPKDCVVFESNPLGIAAAHNCSCKVRALYTIKADIIYQFYTESAFSPCSVVWSCHVAARFVAMDNAFRLHLVSLDKDRPTPNLCCAFSLGYL